MLIVTETVSPTCAKIFGVFLSCIFKLYSLTELTETKTSSWMCGEKRCVSVLKSVG